MLTVVSDRKIAVETSPGSGIVSHFLPDIVSSIDYYAFGGKMSNRHFTNSSTYKYGFNGKENDDEITGWQDYGEREYDTRLARFLSIDPIADEYPHYTPYAFAGNKPIECIDLDGLEDTHYTMYLDRMHSTSAGAAEANKVAQETAPAMEVAIGFTPLGPIADVLTLGKDVFTGNWAAIPLDLAGFIPGGDIVKLKKLEKVVDMSKTVDRLNDTKKLTNKIDADKVLSTSKNNIKKSHGNKLDDKAAEGYTLRDKKTGDVKKYGETTRGEDAFGSGNQKRYSKKELKEKDVYYQKETSGTKKDMHKWQNTKIKEHKSNNGGKRPSLNKSDY